MRKKSDRFPLRMVALISQLGITMMVALFSCLWLGHFISEKTGNVLWFILFLVLGILAGFRSCYTIIQRFVDLGNQNKKKSCQTKGDKGIMIYDKMDERSQ